MKMCPWEAGDNARGDLKVRSETSSVVVDDKYDTTVGHPERETMPHADTFLSVCPRSLERESGG